MPPAATTSYAARESAAYRRLKPTCSGACARAAASMARSASASASASAMGFSHVGEVIESHLATLTPSGPVAPGLGQHEVTTEQGAVAGAGGHRPVGVWLRDATRVVRTVKRSGLTSAATPTNWCIRHQPTSSFSASTADGSG
jgi:hypothetical protein